MGLITKFLTTCNFKLYELGTILSLSVTIFAKLTNILIQAKGGFCYEI